MSDTTTKMEALLTEAEGGALDSLATAREVLATAVIERRTVDWIALHALTIRAGVFGLERPATELPKWSGFVGACHDCLADGVVPMPDGRVATEDGWNYDNCPPEAQP